MRRNEVTPKERELAVIATGGKQYVVRTGQTLTVDKLLTKKDTQEFTDLLSGKKVRAKIIETRPGEKIAVRKFKSKVRYLRRLGFRPIETVLKIEKIGRGQ